MTPAIYPEKISQAAQSEHTHSREWADQARAALLESLGSQRPQMAISRRAMELKRANARWREVKAREADMRLYERMAAGEDITEAEVAEHAERIERGCEPSEKWREHERRRKDRSLRPSDDLRIRRKMCGAGRVEPDVRENYTPSECGVMALIADDVMKHGHCTRTAAQLANAVRCKVRTVRRALATAREMGHLDVQERKAPCGRMNVSNIVRIVSKPWLAWIGRAFAWRPKIRLPRGEREGVTTRAENRELQGSEAAETPRGTIHGEEQCGKADP